MRKTRVYVAGAYSKGDVAQNVREAIVSAEALNFFGYVPYVPHLTHFWHFAFPHPYKFWLEYDKEWLLCCDAVLRIPGESSGADAEVELANSVGIPVFFDIETLAKNLPKQTE